MRPLRMLVCPTYADSWIGKMMLTAINNVPAPIWCIIDEAEESAGHVTRVASWRQFQSRALSGCLLRRYGRGLYHAGPPCSMHKKGSGFSEVAYGGGGPWRTCMNALIFPLASSPLCDAMLSWHEATRKIGEIGTAHTAQPSARPIPSLPKGLPLVCDFQSALILPQMWRYCTKY